MQERFVVRNDAMFGNLGARRDERGRPGKRQEEKICGLLVSDRAAEIKIEAIAAEIVQDLEAALAQFRQMAVDLGAEDVMVGDSVG